MKHIKKINEFFDDDLAISQEMTKDANAEGALQWEKSLIDKIAEVIDELDGDFSGRQISLSQDDKNHLAEAALRYIRKSAEVLSNDPEVSLTEKKINETGEWFSDVDWEYVKNNPDADDECSLWIMALEDKLTDVKELLDNPNDLEIKDIRGFDIYQGPYAMVSIKGRTYKVWTNDYLLFIENFPIDNSEGGELKGFNGVEEDIADAINSLS